MDIVPYIVVMKLSVNKGIVQQKKVIHKVLEFFKFKSNRLTVETYNRKGSFVV